MHHWPAFSRLALTVFSISALTSPAHAQEHNSAGPATEHVWLQKFVGEWTSTSSSVAGPGQAAMEGTGSMRSKMLGKLWIINDMTVEMEGTRVSAIQTLGFDSRKKKFVGSWIDNMLDYQWHYEGHLDKAGNKLTLQTTGPVPMSSGEVGEFRDSYEFKSPDHILVKSEMLGPDGKWIAFMTGELKRRSSDEPPTGTPK